MVLTQFVIVVVVHVPEVALRCIRQTSIFSIAKYLVEPVQRGSFAANPSKR
jgi:hypothetical protein